MKLRFSSDGVHLFDRVTGINILLDEVNLEKEYMSKAPRQISIAVTNKCNLQCPFCYVPKTQSEISLKNLLTWIDELEENGCLGVGFGGGEPTLYEGFSEACRYVTQQTGMAVSFTTNCYGITSKLTHELSGNVNFIRVSMDGVGNGYEKMRGIPFDGFCENLRMIKDIAPFGINCVINSQTISFIDEVASFAESVGAAELLILPEHATMFNNGIDKVTLSRLKIWINEFKLNMKLSISHGYTYDIPICSPFINENSIESFVHVTADGLVKKSSFDTEGIKIAANGIIHAISVLVASGR